MKVKIDKECPVGYDRVFLVAENKDENDLLDKWQRCNAYTQLRIDKKTLSIYIETKEEE